MAWTFFNFLAHCEPPKHTFEIALFSILEHCVRLEFELNKLKKEKVLIDKSARMQESNAGAVMKLKKNLEILSNNLEMEIEEKSKLEFEIERLQQVVQRGKSEKSSIESKVVKLENEIEILSNNLETETEERSKLEFEVDRLQQVTVGQKI